jgi:hypothetical protein
MKNKAKEMGMVTHVSRRQTRTVIDTVRDDIANGIDFWPFLRIFDPALFRKLPDIIAQ